MDARAKPFKKNSGSPRTKILLVPSLGELASLRSEWTDLESAATPRLAFSNPMIGSKRGRKSTANPPITNKRPIAI